MPDDLSMPNPMKPHCVHFPQALKMIFEGKRMASTFMPDFLFIELETPKPGDRMTSPYLSITTMDKETGKMQLRMPWEPGHRAIFSDAWYVSPYDGKQV